MSAIGPNAKRWAPRVDLEEDVPTVEAVLYSGSIYVHSIEVTNTSGGTINLTIKDNVGSPVTWVPATPVPPGAVFFYLNEDGRLWAGGVRWVASGSGLRGRFTGRPI